MSIPASPSMAPVSSPCTGVCQLDPDGLCLGCRRSATEIGAWRGLAEDERRRIMREVLPLRGWRPPSGLEP